MMRDRVFVRLVPLVLAAATVGCEPAATREAGTPASAPRAALPSDLFVQTAPAGAEGVAAAKAHAKVGEMVVLQGRIGGGVKPFAEGVAMFTLMDLSLPSCADGAKDHCKTPWDYCCESAETISANAATVRVVDASGEPLKGSLSGVSGLDPLTEVTVAGSVSQTDNKFVLVVDAKSIAVKPKRK